MLMGRGTPPFRCTAGTRVRVPAVHSFPTRIWCPPLDSALKTCWQHQSQASVHSTTIQSSFSADATGRPVPGGDESVWLWHARESSSTGLRTVSSHTWLTYGSASPSAPSADFGHSVSQSAGVACDSSDRNWPITLPAGGPQTTSRPFVGNTAKPIQARRPLP